METTIGDLIVTRIHVLWNQLLVKIIGSEVFPLFEIAEKYKKKTIIVQSKEYSSIIHLTINDPIPNRGKDVLGELIKVFNENTIKARKEIADKRKPS